MQENCFCKKTLHFDSLGNFFEDINMKKIILAFLSAFALFLTGCATGIAVQVQRPAELDLNGAKSIAILPFQDENKGEISGSFFSIIFMPTAGKSDKKDIADFLTDKVTGSVAQSGYFDLISSSVVENAIKNNESAPCDVYLTGHIDSFRTRVDERREKHQDKEGNEYYVHLFRREVSFAIVYQIIDAQTHKVISHTSERIERQSSEVDAMHNVPSAYNLVRMDIEHTANRLLRKIQPYTETLSLVLLKDKTKNPAMKQADTLAKNRLYDQSEQLFLKVYDETGLMEAGYNAAVLAEVQGKLREAEALMKKVADESQDKKAYRALSDIKEEIAKAEKLRSQLENR